MTRPTKFEILEQIRRFYEIEGTVPGKGKFQQFCGITESDVTYYWPRWSDAVVEAGFEPQSAPARIQATAILEKLASITIETGKFPTASEYRILARDRPDLPSSTTVQRALGIRAKQIGKLREYCSKRPEYKEVLGLTQTPSASVYKESVGPVVKGYVYLRRGPGRYKIGRTTSIPRREQTHKTKTWESWELVHVIETDDPEGIEDYWKRRFKDKNKKIVDDKVKEVTPTEEFYLSEDDVAAFCSRTYQ